MFPKWSADLNAGFKDLKTLLFPMFATYFYKNVLPKVINSLKIATVAVPENTKTAIAFPIVILIPKM